MKSVVLAIVIMGSFGAFGQKPDPKNALPLPVKLEDDGRACFGYIQITPKELTWKSSWSLCHAESWKYVPGGNRINIELNKQTRESKCTIHAIQMFHPAYMQSTWSVAGYHSLADLQSNPDAPVLNCPML